MSDISQERIVSNFINYNSMDWGFRFKTLTLRTSQLLELISHNKIEVMPPFKTHSPWSIVQKSRFIESILIGLPTNNIICEENIFGNQVILDGTQRLLALMDFTNNSFELKDLQVASHLNGLRYGNLQYKDQAILYERHPNNFIIVSYDTSPLLKFEYYKRINSNNTRFLVQTARNYAYPNFYSIVGELRYLLDEIFYFSSETYPTHFREFTFKTLSEQFILYIITLNLIKDGYLPQKEQHESISELLDRSSFYLNDTFFQRENIINYVYSQIQHFLHSNNLTQILIISDTKANSYNFLHNQNINPKHELMSMGEFIGYFIRFMNGEKLNINQGKSFDLYLETKRSSKLLFQSLKGARFDH